jgi:hypothetical protein
VIQTKSGARCVLRRIAITDADEESVKLRFRERKCAFELNRILGGKDEERPVDPAGNSVDSSTVTCRSFIASSKSACVLGF